MLSSVPAARPLWLGIVSFALTLVKSCLVQRLNAFRVKFKYECNVFN